MEDQQSSVILNQGLQAQKILESPELFRVKLGGSKIMDLSLDGQSEVENYFKMKTVKSI